MLVDIKFIKFPRGKIGMRIKDMDESLRGTVINFRYGGWCIESVSIPEIDYSAKLLFLRGTTRSYDHCFVRSLETLPVSEVLLLERMVKDFNTTGGRRTHD